jgi:hypothetical protein
MTDRHPPQRAHDGIEVVLRLVRQPRQAERHAHEVLQAVMQSGTQVLVQFHVARFLHQLQQRRQQRRYQQHRQHGQRPRQCRRNHQPADQQQGQHRRGHQRTAQVVQNFPARQRGQRIAAPAIAGGGRPRQQPWQQLPVAADPAVAALDVGAVA